MCVLGAKIPIVYVGQVGMLQSESDDGSPQSLVAVVGVDKYVGQQGKSRQIGDDPAIANLLFPGESFPVGTHNKSGMSRRLLHLWAGDSRGPIGLGEPTVNQREIQPSLVVSNFVLIVSALHLLNLHHSPPERPALARITFLNFQVLRNGILSKWLSDGAPS